MNIALQSKNGEQIHLLQLDDGEKGIQVVAATIDQKLATYDELSVTIALQEGEALDVGAGDTAVLIDGGEPREYIINEVIETDDEEHTLSFYADLSAVELTDEIVREEVAGKTNSHAQAVAHIMQHTRWQVFDHAENIHARTIDIEMRGKTVIEALTELAAFYGFEYDYVYTMDDTNNITHRVVNLRNQVGADREKRFEIDKDMESVSRTVNAEEIKTAIIAVGNELEDGTRIDLVGLEWKRTDGREVDKTKTADFLEIPEATKAYGRYDHATKRMRPRFLYAEFSAETQESLAIQALDELKRHALPTVTYEAQVVDLYREDMQAYRHEKVGLGDRVAIIDHDFMQTLAVSTRVVEFRRDLLDELNNEIVLGDARDYFPDDAKKSINEINRKLAEEKKEREKLEKKQADFEWEAMESMKWAADQVGSLRESTGTGLKQAIVDPNGGTNYLQSPWSLNSMTVPYFWCLGMSAISEEAYRSHGDFYFSVDPEISGVKDNEMIMSGMIRSATNIKGEQVVVDAIYIRSSTEDVHVIVGENGEFQTPLKWSHYSLDLQIIKPDGVHEWEIHQPKMEHGEKTGFTLNKNDIMRTHETVKENKVGMFLHGALTASTWNNLAGELRMAHPLQVAGASALKLTMQPHRYISAYETYQSAVPVENSISNGKPYTLSIKYELERAVPAGEGNRDIHLNVRALVKGGGVGSLGLGRVLMKDGQGEFTTTFMIVDEDVGVLYELELEVDGYGFQIFDSITIKDTMISEGFFTPKNYIKSSNEIDVGRASVQNLLSYEKLLNNRSISKDGESLRLYAYNDDEGVRRDNLVVRLPRIEGIKAGRLYTLGFELFRAIKKDIIFDSVFYLGEVEISREKNRISSGTMNSYIGTSSESVTFLTPSGADSVEFVFYTENISVADQYSIIYSIKNIMFNEGPTAERFQFSGADAVSRGVSNFDPAVAINSGSTLLDANMIDFEGFQFDASKLVNLSIDDSRITGMDGSKITDASISDDKIKDVDASKIKNLDESKITNLSYKATNKYIAESGEDKTNTDGLVMVPLSSSLISKADLSRNYQVFIQAYDKAQLFVSYRDAQYFTVESDITGKQTRFGWKVEALQKPS